MRKTRQLHLWIGLICSVFILIEAVTGLFLLEPQLLGGSGGNLGGPPQMRQQQPQTPTTSGVDANAASPDARANAGTSGPGRAGGAGEGFAGRGGAGGGFPGGGFPGGGGAGGGGSGAINIIRNLHEGRIGSTNIKWVMDIAAIGMMILTITGIVLSTKTLAAQRVRRKKQRVQMQE
jgi:hypothetical protein